MLALQDHTERACANGGWLDDRPLDLGTGPLYTTAINVLTLEVYYRYENAFGAAANKRLKKGAAAVKSDKPDEVPSPIRRTATRATSDRAPMRNVIALLLPLLAFPRGDGPDLTPVFGRDNAQFARALSRQGYGDLADLFCRKFDGWKEASAEECAAVRPVHLDLKLELAREEQDPLKRKDAIAEVLKAKEEFIAQFPTSPEAEESELSLPDAYRMLGEALTAALEKSTDAAEVTRLREEGAGLP